MKLTNCIIFLLIIVFPGYACEQQVKPKSETEQFTEILENTSESNDQNTSVNKRLNISDKEYSQAINNHTPLQQADIGLFQQLGNDEISTQLIKFTYNGAQNFPVATFLMATDSQNADLHKFIPYHLLYGNDFMGSDNIKLLIIDAKSLAAITKEIVLSAQHSIDESVTVSVSMLAVYNNRNIAAEIRLGEKGADSLRSRILNILSTYPNYKEMFKKNYNPLVPFGN